MPGVPYAGRCLLRHIFSACDAGLQPSEPKPNASAGLAGLGGMGKPGVPIESGCCRSTDRVPVMKQCEHWHESANEALVVQAQGRQFGPLNLNQMKHHMRYSMRYRIRYGAEYIRCVAQKSPYYIAYVESICDIVGPTYDVVGWQESR
jgi:hypothetical protein